MGTSTIEIAATQSATIARSFVVQNSGLPRVSSPVWRNLSEASRAPAQTMPETPFRHLRDELTLLLGVAGSSLVANTWEQYGLSQDADCAGRLRPALSQLFVGAARLATRRGLFASLKRVIGGFEATFFPISGARLQEPRATSTRERRAYLFEASCRTTDWTKAYRPVPGKARPSQAGVAPRAVASLGGFALRKRSHTCSW